MVLGMIKHRLELDQVKDHFEKIIDALKCEPCGCDEIWLFLNRDNDIESLKKDISIAKAFKKELDALNIRFSIETATIGHGHPKSEFYKDFSEEFIVDENGKISYGQYCFRGEIFNQKQKEKFSILASLMPDTIYLDDDLRIKNCASGIFCFCPRCLNEFNKINDTSFSREELKAKIETDLILRKKFLDFSFSGLEEFAYNISKIVAEISPKTHMGLEHGGYAGDGFIKCINAMYKATNLSVRSRSGAGSYNDQSPMDLTNKTFETQWQLAKLPNFVDEYCNEIENYPSTYYSKTVYGTCFEASIHLASGFNSTSVKCWRLEDFELFKETLKECKKRRKYWERLKECSSVGKKSGIEIFVPEKYWEKLGKNWTITPALYGRLYNNFGLPMTFSDTVNKVYYLDEEFASIITEDEIKTLLSYPVITTGTAIYKLNERGFSSLLKIKAEQVDDIFYLEQFTDHFLNGGDAKKVWGETAFFKKNIHYFTCDDDNNAEVLATLKLQDDVKEPNKNFDGKISSLIYKTQFGAKWFIQGYRSDDNLIPWIKRQQINNAVRNIFGGLLAEHTSRNRLMLSPIEDKTGKLINVSIINPTIDVQKEIVLLIRNPISKKAYIMDEFGKKKPVKLKAKNNGFEVLIKELDRWSIKTLFFK